ncbi:MAG: hypothetical protein JOZ24_05195 [Candidatus Eremiobacteraeota bacterium]|nr:hypothetical protein [Candidatus Eremiobacteraeota bacterium]
MLRATLRRIFVVLGAASVALGAGAVAAFAQAPASPAGYTIAIPRASASPAIDGNVDAPAWQAGAKVQLGYDLRNRTPSDQPTTVYVLIDASYLYVGFDAKQRTAVQAAQRTNDVGQGTDDLVSVYLWPDGTKGFQYSFSANPVGTHYQASSENTAFAPSWSSMGHQVAGGYQVTMRIPLRVLRGGSQWRLQFERTVLATFDDYVWAYDPLLQSASSVTYAGHATGLTGAAVAKPQARFGLYGLGEYATPASGGSTSRAGLDASIPFSRSSSFVAAIHPDYSNVEVDQQTIAPTAFARQYAEVRPFFTQLSNYFNNFNCIGCPGIQVLYTNAIPTPRDGFAIEGKQGAIAFGAFDAIGSGRTDSAAAVTVHSKDLKNSVTVQNQAVNGRDVCPGVSGVPSSACFGIPTLDGVHDSITTYNATHDSLKGLYEYYGRSVEAGTFVTNPAKAILEEAAVGAYDKNSFAGCALRSWGPQYLAVPIDAYIQQTDLQGYDCNVSRTWYRPQTAALTRVIVYGNVDRYHDSTGVQDLSDVQAAIGLTFHPRIHLRLQTGSDYTRLFDGNFVPINQNGANLIFNYNTAYPAAFSYFTGRFGPGRLDAWTRSATLRAGLRGTLTAEVDSNFQWLDDGMRNAQTLERLSYARQQGKDSSLALGLRRIEGAFPVLERGQPPFGFADWNVSAAYYKRLPHDELYIVYGDASQLDTRHVLIVKLIHYFGAEKGT